jgi:uncharacterized repeat protein (TIGR03803 family)
MIRKNLIAVAVVVLFGTTYASPASYKALYNFSNTNANPSSGLVVDADGNAYGTTFNGGGLNQSGTIYELSPTTGYHLLYRFSPDGSFGKNPQGNLVFDSSGNLYGTTVYGGSNKSACHNQGCGVIFKLSPSSNNGLWVETVLYSFCSQSQCSDGANPQAGVVFDSQGNLYGTTKAGGNQGCQEAGPGCGTVFELSQNSSDSWGETVLYDFSNPGDGELPMSGVIWDATGNLYSTTSAGGGGNGGTVFELSPVGSLWDETILYDFDGGSADGALVLAGVCFDTLGNLYGTTAQGGMFGLGTVYQLTAGSSGGWIEAVLHSFGAGNDGAEPESSLVLDSLGNIYGTTFAGGQVGCDGRGCGTVFRLNFTDGGQWVESQFRFPNSGSAGSQPNSQLALDTNGDVVGTTTKGGRYLDGVMFRIIQ